MRMSAPGSRQEAEGDLADTGTRDGAGVSTTDQKITNIEDQNFYNLRLFSQKNLVLI